MGTPNKNISFANAQTKVAEISYTALIEALDATPTVPLFDAQVRTAGIKNLENIYQRA